MSQDKPHDERPDQMLSVAEQLSRRASVNDDGQLDLLASIGGWRGLVESVLPSAVFLVAFILVEDIWAAGIGATVIAAIFAIARLIQRQSPLQAFSGLAGVVLCVAVALFTGDAEDYFVPGFYTNAIYGAAMIISMIARWPLMGLIYGFLRSEGVAWRQQPRRRRSYQVATGFIVAMFVARLAVQLPLYFAGEFAALGTARLLMGIPLYAMALWLAWMVSRPTAKDQRTAEVKESPSS